MMRMRKRLGKSDDRARRLEKEGDRLFAKGKAGAALKKFRAVQRLRPDKAAIYKKLVAAHGAARRRWGPKDFAESLLWEMMRQEIEHPEIRKVHKQLGYESTAPKKRKKHEKDRVNGRNRHR